MEGFGNSVSVNAGEPGSSFGLSAGSRKLREEPAVPDYREVTIGTSRGHRAPNLSDSYFNRQINKR
jgi:hypothetical protein